MERALREGNYTPLARFRFITGATVMFRAALRPYLFPVGRDWVHDGWIANIIACLSGIRFIDEPLIYYRQHREQQIGLGTAGSTQPRRSFAEVGRQHWPGIDAHRHIVEEVCLALPRLPVDPQHGAARDFLAQRKFLTERLTLPLPGFPVSPACSHSYPPTGAAPTVS